MPMELLDRITGFLNDETLPILRLTCKRLCAVILDRFCDLNVAHLGCWIFNKDRWERIHNILVANNSPLLGKFQTVTFTMDELEFRIKDDFVVVPSKAEARSPLRKTQWARAKHNIVQEEAALKQRGAADLNLMLRVMHLIRLRGCSVRLDLSPSDPLKDKIPCVSRLAKEVHSNLQRAIAQIRPMIDAMSIDRLRLKDMAEVLAEYDVKVLESYDSIREIKWTPCNDDGFDRDRSKDCKYEVLTAIFTRAHRLRTIYMHTRCTPKYEFEQQWAPNLLRHNPLSKLEIIKLICVPLFPDDLLAILRRCATTLTHFELAGGLEGGRESWVLLLKQLVSMERLRRLNIRLLGTCVLELEGTKALAESLPLLLRAEMALDNTL